MHDMGPCTTPDSSGGACLRVPSMSQRAAHHQVTSYAPGGGAWALEGVGNRGLVPPKPNFEGSVSMSGMTLYSPGPGTWA